MSEAQAGFLQDASQIRISCLSISVLGFYQTLALGFFSLAFMIRNELYDCLPFSYMSLPLPFYPK